jgi:dihydrolipoamide dehydrogenase
MRWGTEVLIVEFMPNIVPVEDEDISKQMERSMKKGVKIMTSSSVEKSTLLVLVCKSM